MNIDWSKAPEGATHYYKNSPQPWRDLSGCVWKYFSNGEWRLASPAGKSAWLLRELGTVLFARPFPHTWSGEGLPPAGTVCEYSLTNGGVWHECTIKYVLANGKQLVADCAGNPDGEAVLHVNTCQFRTLRTPEQIAADKRAADIEAMRADIGWKVPYLGPCPVTLLYDAGYRKQVAP